MFPGDTIVSIFKICFLIIRLETFLMVIVSQQLLWMNVKTLFQIDN